MNAHNTPLRRARRGLSILAAAFLVTSAANAQIPDEFTNLKVLPKDISKGELVGLMRSMAGGLGLRCNGCHVGEDPNSLEGYDFASDEKPIKQTARVMLGIVEEINGKLLPKIGKDAAELAEVRCRTCHHGQQRPQGLRDVLTTALEEGGKDAAIAKYRELRERYYGRDTFDFGEWQLLGLAERLAKAEQVADAYAFVQLNLEYFPDFGMSYVFLGQYHSKKGETEQAITSFEKAIELVPEMAPRIQPLLDRLRGEAGR